MKDAFIYTQKSLSSAKSREKGNTEKDHDNLMRICSFEGDKAGADRQWWYYTITAVYIVPLLEINREYLLSVPSKLPALHAQHGLY